MNGRQRKLPHWMVRAVIPLLFAAASSILAFAAAHAGGPKAVQIGNTPANPVPVQITDPLGNPVRVQRVPTDSPAASAVVLGLSCNFGAPHPQECGGALRDSSTLSSNSYTVPAGNRLVIESYSGKILVPTGNLPLFVLSIPWGSGQYSLDPNLFLSGSAQGQAVFTFDSQSRGYVDSGTSVSMSCAARTPTGGAGAGLCLVSLIGHLEAIE